MSIVTLLEIAESVYGARLALGGREDPDAMSYSALLAGAQSLGSELAGHEGEHLVYIGANGPVVPVLLFGAALARLPLVPLNFRLSAPLVSGLLSQLGPSVVVADDEHRPLARLAGAVPVPSEALWARACDPRGAGAGAGAGEGAAGVDDIPATLLFTSGTSAAPKAVVLRHEQLVAYVLQTVDLASADEDEAILVSVPPYHVAGIGTVLTNIYAGRRIVYLPVFDPAQWLDTARRERVTNAMVVPTMLARLVEYLDGAKAQVPTLRTLAYGGARMPQTVLERAMEAFGETGFVNAYGLTETSSTIAVLGPEEHRAARSSDDPKVRARLSGAGRLVPGVEAEIRGADGAVLGPGEVGELWVRGAQVSGEYRGIGSTLDAHGWFATKDLAHLDDEGYLFIEGRLDDTIIRGAENIAPAEIETVLEEHPAVLEAAVTGVADDEWGQRIAAVVVRRSGAEVTEEELREFVRTRLRGSRTPDEVVFVDELPYGPTGKLLRRELPAVIEERTRRRAAPGPDEKGARP